LAASRQRSGDRSGIWNFADEIPERVHEFIHVAFKLFERVSRERGIAFFG
jgi:hypothetical protein